MSKHLIGEVRRRFRASKALTDFSRMLALRGYRNPSTERMLMVLKGFGLVSSFFWFDLFLDR